MAIPLCPPIPPTPTLFDAWKADPTWLLAVAFAAAISVWMGTGWARWIRKVAGDTTLSRWSAIMFAAALGFFTISAGLGLGVLLPMDDANLAWLTRAFAAVGECQPAIHAVIAQDNAYSQLSDMLLNMNLINFGISAYSLLAAILLARKAYKAYVEREYQRQ
jgi:hypothetical protein